HYGPLVKAKVESNESGMVERPVRLKNCDRVVGRWCWIGSRGKYRLGDNPVRATSEAVDPASRDCPFFGGGQIRSKQCLLSPTCGHVAACSKSPLSATNGVYSALAFNLACSRIAGGRGASPTQDDAW